MMKTLLEDSFDIYLFNYAFENMSSSKLNEFLAFLKFHKVGHPYKFSFVAEAASLIPELTLNQNILIDFSPNSLTESKEVQFHDFLKSPENAALEKLYHTLQLPHEAPEQSDAQMKKVCSLIKSLLYEGDFIFLEAPEADLEPEVLQLFISALKERVMNRRINVLIASRTPEMWLTHANHTVARSADYSFLVEKVPTSLDQYRSWKKERSGFYAPIKTKKEIKSDLKFIYSPKKTKKEAA